MYYVNTDQIEERLAFIPKIVTAIKGLSEDSGKSMIHPLIQQFSKERALQLAIEIVTDVGSLIIDGFLMREASSYEDIIDILKEEQVFDEETGSYLIELVKLRRPLVQQYFALESSAYEGILAKLPTELEKFNQMTQAYLQREL